MTSVAGLMGLFGPRAVTARLAGGQMRNAGHLSSIVDG
jgi:hypothetical protein